MASRDSQQGSALLFVTVIGLVLSLGLGFFLTSTILAEQRAVEGSLAQTRAYWAQMGHYNYALSRISYATSCAGCGGGGNIKDSDQAAILQSYLNELNNDKTWTYPDEASGYSFTVTNTAITDDRPSRHNFSGYLQITSAVATASLLDLATASLPRLELRLCAGLPSAGASCGPLTVNNGGNATAYFSINRLTNLPAN